MRLLLRYKVADVFLFESWLRAMTKLLTTALLFSSYYSHSSDKINILAVHDDALDAHCSNQSYISGKKVRTPLTVQKAQINWHFQKIHKVETSNHLWPSIFLTSLRDSLAAGKNLENLTSCIMTKERFWLALLNSKGPNKLTFLKIHEGKISCYCEIRLQRGKTDLNTWHRASWLR